jgi:hypothetical protein
MKIVPKCKNCKDLDAYKIGKRTFYDFYHPSICIAGKKIYAKNIKINNYRYLGSVEQSMISRY